MLFPSTTSQSFWNSLKSSLLAPPQIKSSGYLLTFWINSLFILVLILQFWNWIQNRTLLSLFMLVCRSPFMISTDIFSSCATLWNCRTLKTTVINVMPHLHDSSSMCYLKYNTKASEMVTVHSMKLYSNLLLYFMLGRFCAY